MNMNKLKYVLHSIQREGFRNMNLRFEQVQKTLRRYKNKKHPSYQNTEESIEYVRELFLDQQIMYNYGYNLERDSEFYIDSKTIVLYQCMHQYAAI